jgi:hypothetical protein
MFGEMDLLGAFIPRAAAWFVAALLIFAAVLSKNCIRPGLAR